MNTIVVIHAVVITRSPDNTISHNNGECRGISHIAKTLRSMSIRYRSDAKVSARYLIDVFALWDHISIWKKTLKNSPLVGCMSNTAADTPAKLDKRAFIWSLLLCNGYHFCSTYVWALQHHSVHALDMSTMIVFVYSGLQFKWNQISTNNSRHTSCIHNKGLHTGKWPDLTTSKPDSASTLGYHWADYTGTTLADVITVCQWQPSVNLHN